MQYTQYTFRGELNANFLVESFAEIFAWYLEPYDCTYM